MPLFHFGFRIGRVVVSKLALSDMSSLNLHAQHWILQLSLGKIGRNKICTVSRRHFENLGDGRVRRELYIFHRSLRWSYQMPYSIWCGTKFVKLSFHQMPPISRTKTYERLVPAHTILIYWSLRVSRASCTAKGREFVSGMLRESSNQDPWC